MTVLINFNIFKCSLDLLLCRGIKYMCVVKVSVFFIYIFTFYF